MLSPERLADIKAASVDYAYPGHIDVLVAEIERLQAENAELSHDVNKYRQFWLNEQDKTKELQDQLAEAREIIQKSRRQHHYCEDSWYSCPKSEDGCADDQWPENECNCGADKWNAKIDKWLKDQEGQG